MKKLLFISILCFTLSACNDKSTEDLVACEESACLVGSVDNTPVGDLNTALPNEAYTFQTNVTFINMTVTQEDKFRSALEMIKRVVATEEFRTRVFNHTFNSQKTFVDNRGYSNARIYQTILDAAETRILTKNNQMDMEVELYTDNTSNVIGYTTSGSKRIWVNTKYFNVNSISSVASNLFHEWLHKLGYSHSSAYTASRPYSVPYAIGNIVGELGRKSGP